MSIPTNGYTTIRQYFDDKKPSWGSRNGHEANFGKGYGADGDQRNFVAQQMQWMMDNGFDLGASQDNFNRLYDIFSARTQDTSFWGTNNTSKMGDMEFTSLAYVMADLYEMQQSGAISNDTYQEYMTRLFSNDCINGLMASDSNHGPDAAASIFLNIADEVTLMHDGGPGRQANPADPARAAANSSEIFVDRRPVINSVSDYAKEHGAGDYYARATSNISTVNRMIESWSSSGLLPAGVNATELTDYMKFTVQGKITDAAMYHVPDYYDTTYDNINMQNVGNSANLEALARAMEAINGIQDEALKAYMIEQITADGMLEDIYNNKPEGMDLLSTLDLVTRNEEYAKELLADELGDAVNNHEASSEPSSEPSSAPPSDTISFKPAASYVEGLQTFADNDPEGRTVGQMVADTMMYDYFSREDTMAYSDYLALADAFHEIETDPRYDTGDVNARAAAIEDFLGSHPGFKEAYDIAQEAASAQRQLDNYDPDTGVVVDSWEARTRVLRATDAVHAGNAKSLADLSPVNSYPAVMVDFDMAPEDQAALKAAGEADPDRTAGRIYADNMLADYFSEDCPYYPGMTAEEYYRLQDEYDALSTDAQRKAFDADNPGFSTARTVVGTIEHAGEKLDTCIAKDEAFTYSVTMSDTSDAVMHVLDAGTDFGPDKNAAKDYDAALSAIDPALLSGNGPLTDFDTSKAMALRIWRGDYGNEPDRTPALMAEGYTKDQIRHFQSVVNLGYDKCVNLTEDQYNAAFPDHAGVDTEQYKADQLAAAQAMMSYEGGADYMAAWNAANPNAPITIEDANALYLNAANIILAAGDEGYDGLDDDAKAEVQGNVSTLEAAIGEGSDAVAAAFADDARNAGAAEQHEYLEEQGIDHDDCQLGG